MLNEEYSYEIRYRIEIIHMNKRRLQEEANKGLPENKPKSVSSQIRGVKSRRVNLEVEAMDEWNG